MNYLTVILGLLLFTGCYRASQKKEKNTQGGETVTVNADQARDVHMSELFKKVRYIPLRLSDNQQIGRIEKMIITDTQIALLDVAAKCVWIFTLQGALVHRIDIPPGEGPGEVRFLGDFAFDQQQRIHALGAYKMVVYSMNGTLKNEFRVDYPAYKFAYLDDSDTYVIYTGNSLYKTPDISNTGSNLVFLNASGKLEGQALPINFLKRGLAFMRFNNFPVFKDKTLFFDYPDPIIYQVKDKHVGVRYKLDFGKYAIPPKTYKLRENYSSSLKFYNKEVGDKGYVSYTGFFLETDSIIYFTFEKDDKIYMVFHKKESGKTMVASHLINDIDYGYSLPFRVAKGQTFFTILQPYDLLNRVKSMRKKHPQRLKNPQIKNLLELTDTLSTYDNPVIMAVTLK